MFRQLLHSEEVPGRLMTQEEGERLAKQHRILCSKLRGHFGYFGVRCNMRAMQAVRHHAERVWRYWFNHRSSKKALNWERFQALKTRMPLPTPKIVHGV